MVDRSLWTGKYKKEYIPHVLGQLGVCEPIVRSSRGKLALIWLIGHYGQVFTKGDLLSI